MHILAVQLGWTIQKILLIVFMLKISVFWGVALAFLFRKAGLVKKRHLFKFKNGWTWAHIRRDHVGDMYYDPMNWRHYATEYLTAASYAAEVSVLAIVTKYVCLIIHSYFCG